jgi:hypothetical protein
MIRMSTMVGAAVCVTPSHHMTILDMGHDFYGPEQEHIAGLGTGGILGAR